jgi:hypothetical protein
MPRVVDAVARGELSRTTESVMSDGSLTRLYSGDLRRMRIREGVITVNDPEELSRMIPHRSSHCRSLRCIRQSTEPQQDNSSCRQLLAKDKLSEILVVGDDRSRQFSGDAKHSFIRGMPRPAW